MTTSKSKLKTLAKLGTLRELWAWEGKKVVFTNGVFDILHAGHVELLEKSKAKGDLLIVGLNSDASARRLGKGPGRPVNKFPDRAAVLCALSCVDALVGFDEDTPERVIERLRPDVLIKGADYRLDQIAGARYAKKVVRIALKKGYSTTGLIKKITGCGRS